MINSERRPVNLIIQSRICLSLGRRRRREPVAARWSSSRATLCLVLETKLSGAASRRASRLLFPYLPFGIEITSGQPADPNSSSCPRLLSAFSCVRPFD